MACGSRGSCSPGTRSWPGWRLGRLTRRLGGFSRLLERLVPLEQRRLPLAPVLNADPR